MIPFRRWPRAGWSILAAAVVACGGDSGTSIGVVSVEVLPGQILLVGLEDTLPLTAYALDDSGDQSVVSAEWSSSNPAVASIGAAGVARAASAGTTTITAKVGGVQGSAPLEVYVPEAVAAYVPGTSYFGRNDYVEYVPGELPVILSAPHGGGLEPGEIPDRSYGTTVTDSNTRQLTLAVRDALVELTGYAPHVVISHLRRTKLDPNREIVEAAQGSPYAERAWHEFQDWISEARAEVIGDFDRGMYFDMHGHGHDIARLELGYLLTTGNLEASDATLNSISVIASTSIRELGRVSELPFSQLLRGPTSFGGLLEAEGVPAVPSPSNPSPEGAPYFSGGYNTATHGSRGDSEMVDGIQIEHHREGIRDTEANRLAYAEKLARVIRGFMLEHYGFFEPGG